MFIKITDKESLLKALKDNADKEIVIHYNCSSCDDEQITDWFAEIDERMFETLEKEDCLYVTYPCTECGYSEKFIFITHIQGIEIND